MEIKKALILDVQNSTQALYKDGFTLEMNIFVGKIYKVEPAPKFEGYYYIVGEPLGYCFHESWLDFDFDKKPKLPVSTILQINNGRSYYTCNCGNVKELRFKVLNLQEYSFCPVCKGNTLWIKTPNAKPISEDVRDKSKHPGLTPDKIKEIPCVTNDTLIEAEQGPAPIRSLVEKPGPKFIRMLGSNTMINLSKEFSHIDKTIKRALGVPESYISQPADQLAIYYASQKPKSLKYTLLTREMHADYIENLKESKEAKQTPVQYVNTLMGEKHQIGNIKGLDIGFKAFIKHILKKTGGTLDPELYLGYPLITIPQWETKSKIWTSETNKTEYDLLQSIKGVEYLRYYKDFENKPIVYDGAWCKFPQSIHLHNLCGCIKKITYDIVILRLSKYYWAVLKQEIEPDAKCYYT